MARRTEALLLLALAVLCLLCACGSPAPAPASSPLPTPEPPPAATPAPTLAPSPPPTAWTVTDESAEEILALGSIHGLRRIDAAGSREYAALRELRERLPDCEIRWTVPLQGAEYPDDTDLLSLSSTEGLEEAMAGLPELKTVELYDCEPEIELMDRLYTAYPEVDFLWRFTFGQEGRRQWTVSSDCSCFSSLWTGEESYRYTEADYYPLLRFCRHLRALDLGHSDLGDLTLIGELSELQVLILADNPRITDISPLGKLHDLMYLELFLCCDIEDFSCLFSMPKMMDLNLSYCRNLEDVSFIDVMPDFRSGWFRNSKVTWAMVKPYLDSRGQELRFVVGYPADLSSIAFGWRDTERSRAIRKAFLHWKEVEDFRSWDDVVYRNE